MRLNKREIRVQKRENLSQGAFKDEYTPLSKDTKLVDGKWYVIEGFRKTILKYKSGNSYGFWRKVWGKWRFSQGSYNCRIATDTEVGEYILEEAKRRYKDAATVKCLYDGSIDPVDSEHFEIRGWQGDYELFWANGLPCVYEDGKWAEIINKNET